MDKNLNANIRHQDIQLANGTRIGLPLTYGRWPMFSGSFPVLSSRVQKLLPSPKLKPVQVVPGIAVISLAAFQYREIESKPEKIKIQDYDELAIMVAVMCEPRLNIPALPLFFPNRFSAFGFYMLHVPVTTQEACDIGVQGWGYPKFVADIDIATDGPECSCRVNADGQHIITLTVKKTQPKPRVWSFYAYTLKDNHVVKTRVQSQGQLGQIDLPGGASYVLGDHPIAETLRGLGMSRVALSHAYTPGMHSTLPEAEDNIPV